MRPLVFAVPSTIAALFAAPAAFAAEPTPAMAAPTPSGATVVLPVETPTLGASLEAEPAMNPKRKRHRLEWDPRWHRFRTIEYVTTAATGVAAIGVFLFAHPSDHPKWIGPILFDEPVRNAFRLRTRSGIQTALDASFYTALITPAQSLFDSLVLPLADANVDLFWQLAMMDAQAYALSGLVTASLYDTVGRARPSYEECKAGTSVDPLCGAGAYASFPSGHTSQAMTGAALLCAHHGALPLYGGGAWDVAACVEGITIATGVGVLRLMADRHYASDVLTGGAIGFFSGYALPRLLHYWKRPPGELVSRDDFKMSLALGGVTTPYGAQLLGFF